MSAVLLYGSCYDALGMPFESQPADNPLLLAWDGKTFLGSEHHGLKPGQITDDSQFSKAIAQSLIDCNGFDPDDLSHRYMELFTSNTIRGYGRTTKTAIDALIAGTHWSQSGVCGSIGNGTAMRSASFGVWFRDDLPSLMEVAAIDAKMTHNSDEAIAGSLAIALTCAYAINGDLDDLLKRLHERLPDSKVKTLIYSLPSLLVDSIQPSVALKVLGTKCDVRETVPSVLYLFLKFGDMHQACETGIRAGGDTDSTGSITASLFGAKIGMSDDPWFQQVEDYDRLVQMDSQLYNRSSNSFLME